LPSRIQTFVVRFSLLLPVLCLGPAPISAQIGGQSNGQIAPGTLDPARDPATLRTPPITPLREQFIWTQGDAAALDPALQARVHGQDDKIAPHFFRVHFHVAKLPREATLYLAGPRSATVLVNGVRVLQFGDEGRAVPGFTVLTADVAQALKPGDNVLALEEVRGHSSLHTGASPTINQVTYGEVLALKIIPRSVALDAPPLLISDASWRSTLEPSEGWSATSYDDSKWPQVQTLGVLGSKSDFLQWNADAGLYAWPGYTGIGSTMRTFRLPRVSFRDLVGASRLKLTPQGGITVLPGIGDAAVTLDFGREVSGRLHLVSTSNTAMTVDTSYGESAEEALGHPYLGHRGVTVPAQGEAFGPKSAFRYARLTFPPGGSQWSRIDVEGIAYPVRYQGSFESSDLLLNQIWETGAYTAHLCMQQGIWDAPKRDRGRWMGDLDVTGRVISSVFADRDLMEQTMDQVIGASPVTRDVNTIAGYSALWITGQADFYRHLGDLAYLRSGHQRLLELLALMDGELDATGRFTNPANHKVFVDWSDGFSADTPEARAATQLEFYLAYRQAVYLLSELGDTEHAATYRRRADQLQSAAQTGLLDPATHTFGDRWQTNAMAVISGAATEQEQAAVWSHVLSRVNGAASKDVITPYYGFYVLGAMAKLDQRPAALDWMRRYWGGMIDEGATSFWEAYDPHWPKQDFHASLEADGKKGYYVSLAHGWSSGPTAWLMQQILGIEPTGPGFRTVTIRPDLAGLAWARGAEPTPRGLLRVSITPRKITIRVPPATTAKVILPFTPGTFALPPNVQPASSGPGETVVTVTRAGEYIFTAKIP